MGAPKDVNQERRGSREQRDEGGRRDEARSGHPPTDVGRTSGGGNLGHKQPPEVEEQNNTRNTGSRSDPVMPADDATLKTKI